jgi:hypothetical protein
LHYCRFYPHSQQLRLLFIVSTSVPKWRFALRSRHEMQPEQNAASPGKSIMHLIRPTSKAATTAGSRIQYTLQQIRAIGADPSLKVQPPAAHAFVSNFHVSR